jgi:hypothetical protein
VQVGEKRGHIAKEVGMQTLFDRPADMFGIVIDE